MALIKIVILDLPFFLSHYGEFQGSVCKRMSARPALINPKQTHRIMEGGVVDSPVVLVIRAPNQKYSDQTINCCQDWTVEKLKAHLSDVYPSKPVSISRKTSPNVGVQIQHLIK